MLHRLYATFVISAWLASMGWLFVAKIWPTLRSGEPPNYAPVASREQAEPVVWRISWNDRRVGTATSQPMPASPDHPLRYRHVVQFQNLPLDLILSEVLGPFASVLKPAFGSPDRPVELEMLFATELRFDTRGNFTGFQTVGDLSDMKNVLQLDGRINERRKLQVRTRFGSLGTPRKRLHHEIDLPSNAVVSDALAPRAELRDLHVGQQWTIPIYRPFPPNSPPQIVAAHAERHELILWDGEDVETVLVVYYDDAGSGLGANREPIAREWVRKDGIVLQHEVRWASTTIRFERMGETFLEPIVELLDDEKHPRLWTPSNRL